MRTSYDQDALCPKNSVPQERTYAFGAGEALAPLAIRIARAYAMAHAVHQGNQNPYFTLTPQL